MTRRIADQEMQLYRLCRGAYCRPVRPLAPGNPEVLDRD